MLPAAPIRQASARCAEAAQAFLAEVAEVAATPNKMPPPACVGLRTCCQPVPFQCTISVLLKWSKAPTAQALLADVAATPDSLLVGGISPGTAFRLRRSSAGSQPRRDGGCRPPRRSWRT